MLNSYETIRNLYIRTANVKAVLNAYKMRVISASEYKKILGEDAPGNPFDDMKAEKIALSKKNRICLVASSLLIWRWFRRVFQIR